jgi:hypothetical protein
MNRRKRGASDTGTDQASDRDMEKVRVEQHSFMGTVWLAGWLFTLGYLHLAFWRGVLAILLWPYYLGAAYATLR